MPATSEDDFDPYEGCELLRALVEEALSAYRGLSAADMEDLRDFLIVHTTTHPAVAPLYARLKQRKPKDRSGVAAADTAEDDALRRAVQRVAGARRGERL